MDTGARLLRNLGRVPGSARAAITGTRTNIDQLTEEAGDEEDVDQAGMTAQIDVSTQRMGC